jgi:hypothetical protein
VKYRVEHKKLNTSVIVLALFLLIASCGSNKNSTSTSQSSIESNPKIIFLNYSIKKNTDARRSIQFINKKVVDGQLKRTNNIEVGDFGDLICHQLDKNSKILQSVIIKNPLKKTIEYLDSEKTFQLKRIDLDSVQFSIRLKLKSNTKYITLDDISNFGNSPKPLIKTKIY